MATRKTEKELKAKLIGELADVYIYLDLLFQRIGVDVDLAVATTFNAKSAQIGSPIRV